MVSMGDNTFRISSRGWTSRGHRIWAVFDESYPDQVALIASKPYSRPEKGKYRPEEFVRIIEVVDRLPWEPYDENDPLQLDIMARRYPQETQ